MTYFRRHYRIETMHYDSFARLLNVCTACDPSSKYAQSIFLRQMHVHCIHGLSLLYAAHNGSVLSIAQRNCWSIRLVTHPSMRQLRINCNLVPNVISRVFVFSNTTSCLRQHLTCCAPMPLAHCLVLQGLLGSIFPVVLDATHLLCSLPRSRPKTPLTSA